MTAPVLRLIADDLTGALDTAAELTGLCGAVPVRWDEAGPTGSLAMDSGTREMDRDAAVARLRVMAPALAGADIAYKKIDSLLRGQVAAELAACLASRHWAHCILAPAFPAQGRIMRDGAVLVRQADGGWAAVARDLIDELRSAGLQPRPLRDATDLPQGLVVIDAESEADLARIAALGRAASGPVLWCGSGGLARAIAGDATAAMSSTLRGPVLGLFGSDQPATERQLAACGACRIGIADGGCDDAERVAGLMRDGAALVSVDLPQGMHRTVAARRIAEVMTTLVHRLPRPGTLLVAGGETLRAVCRAVGAAMLEATGVVGPGVPRSTLRGGVWDGLSVVSKSGAFGGDALWRDLLAENGLLTRSINA